MSYLSIIQKDLPLATWGLDETPSSTAASDTFINAAGTYSAAQSVKSVPFVYGSEQSVILDDNDTEGYALKIPSLDRLSEKTKREAFSIEFWIKSVDSATTSQRLQILGKLNHHHTGVYIDKSSVIAMVGDTAGTYVATSVALPNIHKPLHIVMSYVNNSVSLFVNGQMSTASVSDDVILEEYDELNEYFTFIAHPGEALFALDNVAIYSRVLDIQTVRRHLAYGLGYELPNQVPASFGGIRYNMAMSGTKPMASYQHPWSYYESIDNVIIKDGCLRINSIMQPELKHSTDTDSTVFTFDANGLSTTAGGYVEIDSPTLLAGGLEHGFAFTFEKTASISGTETLVYITNKYDVNRYLHIYIENNNLKYDLNGTIATLKVSLSTTETLLFGYYYSVSNLQLTVFCNGGTGSDIADSKFYPENIRLLSKPTFNDTDEYSSDDTVSINTAISRIFDVTTPVVVGDEKNKYVATPDASEKRFIMSATGEYIFNVDAKRLCGTNTVIGNNTVSWGNGSNEVEVSLEINPDSVTSYILNNRGPIEEIITLQPGTNKYLTFRIYMDCNDVELNPTKVYYFNLFTYKTDGSYHSTIVCDGPDIDIDSSCWLPPREETPFLYNEESGGLFVNGTATIDYDYAPISYSGSDATPDTSTISSISFFINPLDTAEDILTVGTDSVTYSTPNLTASTGTVYVNGVASSALTDYEWNHVTIVFDTAIALPESIVFGGTTSGFYLDEVIVMGKSLTADEALQIFNLYKGNNVEIIDAEDNSLNIVDTELSNTDYGFSEYQPLNDEAYLLNQVDFVVSTKPTTYSTPASLSVDGELLSVGDRVLVTGASPGIYTVTSLVYGDSIGWSSAETLSGNSLVFVNSGAVGKGKYYYYNGSSWAETVATPKVKSYSVSTSPFRYVDAYSSIKI